MKKSLDATIGLCVLKPNNKIHIQRLVLVSVSSSMLIILCYIYTLSNVLNVRHLVINRINEYKFSIPRDVLEKNKNTRTHQSNVKDFNHKMTLFTDITYNKLRDKYKYEDTTCLNTKTKPQFIHCRPNLENQDTTSDDIYENGTYKGTMNLFLGELLKISTFEGNDTPILIDIGDNLGYQGLYAAKLGYKTWVNEQNKRNLVQIYQSVIKSNLTHKVVLIQTRKNKNGEHSNTDAIQNNFISNILNYIPEFLSIYQNKNKSDIPQQIILSDILDYAFAEENPKRIVIKLNLEADDCTTLQGAMLIFRHHVFKITSYLQNIATRNEHTVRSIKKDKENVKHF